jgi:hypothetical protein
MKRFLTVVAATAVAAAITIPAVADSGAPSDELGTFATCLRAHGIPIPADLEGVAITQWVGDHQDTPGLDAAFEACDPKPRQGDKPDNAAPEQLIACLRTKGLNPPGGLNEFKPWLLQQSRTSAGKDARKACGFAGVEEKRGTGCGADRAEASRARTPKAPATPTT